MVHVHCSSSVCDFCFLISSSEVEISLSLWEEVSSILGDGSDDTISLGGYWKIKLKKLDKKVRCFEVQENWMSENDTNHLWYHFPFLNIAFFITTYWCMKAVENQHQYISIIFLYLGISSTKDDFSLAICLHIICNQFMAPCIFAKLW